jgi:tetratricopeptide (TPR) repeat protein
LLESFQIDAYSIMSVDIVQLKNEEYEKPENRKIALMIDDSTKLIKEGKFAKALSICEDALKIDPNDVVIIAQKGVAFSRLQNLDEAIKCFDLSLQKDPDFVHAIYNKATVKILQNDVAGALSLLEQSINLDSRFRMIAKNDEDFFYLKNNPDFMMLVGN